jgi:hypothetical protein
MVPPFSFDKAAAIPIEQVIPYGAAISKERASGLFYCLAV